MTDCPGDVPSPNPELDTLRKHVDDTSLAARVAILGALVALVVLALPSVPAVGIGSITGMLLLSAVLQTAIIMKILYCLRGGNLTLGDVAWLMVEILFSLAAFVACVGLMIVMTQ